jgi:hypothetical protein
MSTLPDHVEASVLLRGMFINEVILLEKIIDNWLAKYFCKNKKRQKEMFELILCHDRLTYSSKVQVFIFLVQNHCKQFQNEHPAFAKDLAEIGEKRNMLAHWLLDSTYDAVAKKELRFIKAKKMTPSIPFTSTDIVKLNDDILKYKQAIYCLVTPPIE